jgi:hypothetical protein
LIILKLRIDGNWCHQQIKEFIGVEKLLNSREYKHKVFFFPTTIDCGSLLLELGERDDQKKNEK